MSRDRVYKAIRFEGPDRPPLRHQDILPSTLTKHGPKLLALFDEYPPDMLSLSPSMPTGHRPPPVEQPPTGRRWVDEWGSLWESLDDTMGQVIKPAVGSWEALASLEPPPASDPHRYTSAFKARTQTYDKFCTGKIDFGIWDRIRFLRGTQAALMDLALEVDNLKRLADKILAYNVELIRQWAVVPGPTKRVDGVYITDDFGLEKRTIMSPKTWRDIFKPRYAAMVEAAHSAQVAVQYHSCGDIWHIVPDLVEIGVDILGPLQAPPLSIAELGREFAGEVTFLGLVDANDLMVEGTPGQVADRVVECIETLGTARGGYIAAPTTTIMPDVPYENIEALIRTAGEYRY